MQACVSISAYIYEMQIILVAVRTQNSFVYSDKKNSALITNII